MGANQVFYFKDSFECSECEYILNDMKPDDNKKVECPNCKAILDAKVMAIRAKQKEC